jgi:hypothetical protein
MKISRYLSKIAAGITLAALAGCGGGGGGGVSPVVYSGNTSPAVITTTNASVITANVIGTSDAAAIVGGIATEGNSASENQRTGPGHLARLLAENFRKITSRMNLVRPAQQSVAGVQIDITEPCDADVGTLRIFGPLDDIFLTGTVTFVFSNCLLGEITVNGRGSMRIDVFLTDFTMSFARLTLRGTGLSIDAGGSIRLQDAGNTLTITMNLDEINNSTGKMRKSANLVIVNVFNDILNPTTSFTQTLTGQVFHSDHGFVDVATTQPFFFVTLEQLFPDSGQMVLTGAPVNMGNRTIRATALTSPPAAMPASMVRLELDLDGDGVVFEIDARMLWTQLTGPVGANLEDTDGDGMHNSWESFYGLNPGLDDAAGDKDVDGQTNIQEYMAGTTP